MMFSFDGFDRVVEANDFWTLEIGELNVMISSGHADDAVSRKGISLVVGCPMPETVLSYVGGLRSIIGSELCRRGMEEPIWRKDLSALHVTVYGVTRPADYRQDSRPLSETLLDDCEEIVRGRLPFKLAYQGFGILGRGAIAVRVCDSDELMQMRLLISRLPEASRPGYVELNSINQMVIGRLPASLGPGDAQALKELYSAFQNSDEVESTVEELALVHYEHEFLDRVSGRLSLPH